MSRFTLLQREANEVQGKGALLVVSTATVTECVARRFRHRGAGGEELHVGASCLSRVVPIVGGRDALQQACEWQAGDANVGRISWGHTEWGQQGCTGTAV